MAIIEADGALKAAQYTRPLRFTYDRSLEGGHWRYVYEQGAVRCSRVGQYNSLCRMAPEQMNAIARPNLQFVYMDCGRWGGKEYSFGLVCGRDVYLCEYVPSGTNIDAQPVFRNKVVGELFAGLAAARCSARVLNYAQAPATGAEDDTEIYILIPDFHLAPVSWYFDRGAVSVARASDYRDPPAWFRSTRAFQADRYVYARWYGLKWLSDDARQKNGTRLEVHPSDIFGEAGRELAAFVRAFCRLPVGMRSRLHIINMGDTCELWLNREYQFMTEGLAPAFVDGGIDRTAAWAAEVMLWNMEVFDALHDLENSGVAEVKYLWGNHDAYLMSGELTGKLGIPARQASYTAQGGRLHVEHGHRFDSSNHDAISRWDGPFWANTAYHFPAIREAEDFGRNAKSVVTGSPQERDCYFLGASLLYLNAKYKEKKQPFSVFCMGHTHARYLRTFNITGLYSLWGNSQ